MLEITETICGFTLHLQTKPGVFSKTSIDVGSRLLLENITVQDGSMIADLGCGSGCIGFIAAKLNPKGHVHLLDVNLRTIALAKENAQRNDLNNVEIFLSDLFSAVGDQIYDQILSNPPMHIGNEFLTEAAVACYNHLKQNGSVTWVVQKHIRPYIKRLFIQQFGNCEVLVDGQKHIVVSGKKL